MDFFQSCEQLFAVTRIPLGITTAQGVFQKSFPPNLTQSVNARSMQFVLMDFSLQNRDELHPLITYVDPGYFVGVVKLPGDQYCVIGLVSPFRHTREEILRLVAESIAPDEIQSYCDMMLQAPLVNLYQLKALIALLVKLAHGVEITEESIRFVDNTVFTLYGQQKLGSALFDLREEAEFHVPVDFETGVCAAIEAGDAELLNRRLLVPSQGKVGRMSANPLQQQKYSFVIFATLITRAAIRGGLSDEVAFSLSDIYCQRADVQAEISALEQLAYAMAVDFCSRVAEARQQAIQSPPIRACVDYISEHLHEELRLDELSRHCGLCTRSLSLKFKAELGMGIPEYIHREKLREAKYLLEHTKYTLTQITTFLNYPTQSYFTQIFKKYEGCTPQQFRDDPRGLRRK